MQQKMKRRDNKASLNAQSVIKSYKPNIATLGTAVMFIQDVNIVESGCIVHPKLHQEEVSKTNPSFVMKSFKDIICIEKKFDRERQIYQKRHAYQI
jgi:uncharacterized protein